MRPANTQGSALTPPRLEALSPTLEGSVIELYRALGGCLQEPYPFRPGAWDLAFEDGLVVELDEELHFNRYRQLTLLADWTSPLPWRREFIGYCIGQEARCIAAGRWGKRWTNASSEVMFGAGDPPGQLGAGGAPRWKQRALYDAIKDALALSDKSVRLARVAIYDEINGIEVGAALEDRASIDPRALRDLVISRAT